MLAYLIWMRARHTHLVHLRYFQHLHIIDSTRRSYTELILPLSASLLLCELLEGVPQLVEQRHIALRIGGGFGIFVIYLKRVNRLACYPLVLVSCARCTHIQTIISNQSPCR
jgi:hypothetical protein